MSIFNNNGFYKMQSILAASLLLLALVSCGDDASPTNSDESYHKLIGSIKGKLIDASTEEPISGAFIKTSPLSSTTKSNEDGTFFLETIGPELYDIIITHNDYIEFKDKIRVSADITNDILFSLTSKESLNSPPSIPEILYPRNQSFIGSKKFQFRWSATDINTDSLKYDVYFGVADKEMELIAENEPLSYFEYSYDFVEGIEYQWQVIVKDKYSQTPSEIALFAYKEKVVVDLPNLIANWKLDGDAIDSGINGYDGLEQNIQYVDDRYGNKSSAAYFKGSSGTNSKILISNEIQLQTDFTISMWVKPDPTLGENSNVGYYEFLSKWGSGKAGAASWAFGIYKDMKVFLGTYGNASTVKISSLSVTQSQWHHVAVTFKNGSATFYLNGKSSLETTGFQTPQVSNLNIGIGARPDQLSSFHGAIDDIYLFSRALTESEILSLIQ